jgi:hypothetical protein
MALEPDATEFAMIESACRAEGMQSSAITTDAIEAFKRGDYTIETVTTWVADLKQRKPHCFAAPEQLDYKQQAFESRNVTARGRMVKDMGLTMANARARECGLKDIHDYKSKATRPDGKSNGDNKQKTPDKTNPWSRDGWSITRPGQVAKSLGLEEAAALARAAGSFVGARVRALRVIAHRSAAPLPAKPVSLD